MSYFTQSIKFVMTPLKHMCFINPEILPETTNADFEFSYIDIGSVFHGAGIVSREKFSFGRAPSRARKPVKTGDVIISTVRTYLRAIAKIEGEDDGAIVSTGFAVCRANEETDPRFLHAVLQSLPFIEWVVASSTGVSYPAINPSILGGICIPKPDLPTQKRIAAFLGRETARIDDLIAKKERLVEVLEEKRLSSLEHLVSYGISEEVSFRRILNQIEQGWSPDCEARKIEGAEWGVLKVGCVNGWSFNPEEHKALPANMSHRPELEVRNGDILMSRANTPDLVGSVSLVNGVIPRLMLCDKLYRLKLDTRLVTPNFAVMFLRSRKARDHYASSSNGASSSMQNISQEIVRSLKFPLLPILEQDRRAKEFDTVNSKIEQIFRVNSSSIDRLREYRAALITAAVTGQIDVETYDRSAQPEGDTSVIQLPDRITAGVQPDRRRLRTLIAAEIISRHGSRARLGRIKMQKLMFLAEAHANLKGIAGSYQRYRHGPYDSDMVAEIESSLRKAGYYDATEVTSSSGRKIEYNRMPAAGDHTNDLEDAVGGRVADLRAVIDKFVDMNTKFTEGIATLYAVWNDAMLDGQNPDATALVEAFRRDWHENKLKFRESDLRDWLSWMRRNDLVPHGTGPRTIPTITPSLFENE